MDDDGRYEEEAPDNSTTDDEDDHTDKETNRNKLRSCAGRERDDVTADVEPTTPDSEQGDDTTEHNNQDLNEHEESSHDADSNPCFDEIPEDNPEDELEPWVDCMRRAQHRKRTTCSQQTESRRGFSDRARSTAGRQG